MTEEDEFAAASASGDLAAIDKASAAIDALDKPKMLPTLIASALWYGEQGIRVFPLTPSTKIPFKGSRGCLDATADPEAIAAWWGAEPDANIGIATGYVIDVIDIDGIEGQRSRVNHWEDIFERADNDACAKVLTPRRGGLHLYVPATGDPNSTNIVPSIDYRGIGGYVVAPPSRTPEGRYRFLGTPNFSGLAA